MYLLVAVVLGVFGEIGMRLAREIWHNNMPIVHLYTIIEFYILLSVFYYNKRKLLSNKSYWGLIVGFLIFALWNILFYQGIWKDNFLVRSLEGMILITFSVYYFYDLLKGLNILYPERTFMFWFSTGILIYFGGNLMLHLYSSHLTEIAMESAEKLKIWHQIWVINYILNIFLYISYSIAFLCKEPKTIRSSS